MNHRMGTRWAGRALVLAAVALAPAGCSVWTGSAFRDKEVPAHRIVQAPAEPEKVVAVGATSAATDPSVVEYQPVRVDPPKQETPPTDYRVGPNDTLFISVSGLPNLSSNSAAAPGSKVLGSRVDGKGNIQLPLVKTINVAGLTVTEIQTKIQDAFKKYVAEPWVTVEVVEFLSQPVYLVGKFNKSGVYYMDRPTNVIQALAMGGGIDDEADLRGARVQRNGRVLPVDIYRLLREGDTEQNVWLKGGDTVFVPNNLEQQVFVLGSVDKPGAVPMVQGRLNLVEALAASQATIRPSSSLQRVRVIRPISPTRGELIVVDMEKILRGEALPFQLAAGDVVYVPRSRLGTWNDVLREILPSLQAMQSLLQPFVLLAATEDDSN